MKPDLVKAEAHSPDRIDGPLEKVRELRLQGKSHSEIAKTIGLSVDRVYALCESSFYMPSTVRALRTERGVSVARLELALDVAIAIASDAGEDPRARLAAISQIVTIEQRRAKLLGLDSPEGIAEMLEAGEGSQKTLTPERAAEIMRRHFGLVGPKKEGE